MSARLLRPIVAIVQARTGSSRLPGKILMPVMGKPLLAHVIFRLKACKTLDRIVVATTTENDDTEVELLCRANQWDVYRGHPEDVLSRYFEAASAFEAQTIVRITGDCPCMDPKLVDELVSYYSHHSYDYVSNTLVPTYPDGYDIEVFSKESLETADLRAKKLSEREHVTPFIKQEDQFSIHNIASKHQLGHLRVTVDEESDFKMVRALYSKLYPRDPLFGLDMVVNCLESDPKLRVLNAHVGRDEGYLLSLQRES
jgi:spore coat polysaccharide biosynthesis protein SpsF